MKAIFILILISLFNVCLNKKQWWHDSKVIEFTSENITDYLGSDKYIILQFYTKWCVYCRTLFPIYEEIFKIFNSTRKDIIISKINADENSKISEEYGIFAFPNIALFKPGSKKMSSLYIGKADIRDIYAWIQSNCPIQIKKNLKGNTQENANNIENVNISLNKGRTTEENEYFKRKCYEIKERLNKLEEQLKKFKTLKTKYKTIKIQKKQENVTKIKINAKVYFIIIMFTFIFKITKLILFSSHKSLPKHLHQKA